MHIRGQMSGVTSQMRQGATLTEVLMSLLIMSIGVVSVISLFPISIVRAIQATQLTNGKFCEQNAEQIVTTSPSLLYGNAPQWVQAGSYTPVATGDRLTPGGTGDAVIAPIRIGSHQPAVPKLFICRDNTGGNPPPLNGGVIEPDWEHPIALGSDVDGDGIEDYGVTDNEIVWQVDTRARVIDPYGAIYIESGFAPTFGHLFFATPTAPLTAADPILRLNPFAGLSLTEQVSRASQFFALPDSWVLDVEAIPAAFTPPDSTGPSPGNVTLSTDAELPYNPATVAPGLMRITLVNINGTAVTSRVVDNTASTTTYLEFGTPDLPFSFDADGDGSLTVEDIGSVRIEHFEPRYTWLYSISAAGPHEQPRVSCVVFFNRGFNLDDEFLYFANFGNPDADADGDPDVDGDGAPDVGANNQVRIWWDPAAGHPDPAIKAGGYIFDGTAGHWYQIVTVNETDIPAAAGGLTALMTLSEPVYVPTFDDPSIPGGNPGRAMLMQGIIQVFDLEL